MTEPEPRPPLNGGTVAGGVVLGLLGVPVSLVILALVGLSLGPIGSAIVLLGGTEIRDPFGIGDQICLRLQQMR